MDAEYIEVGCVCVSRAGHDKGKHYLVMEVQDERFVLLCDGMRRTLRNPKKKQIKHIALGNWVAQAIAAKVRSQKSVYDFEVANALDAYVTTLTGKEG